MKKFKIGVMDSGVGGLTVAREIAKNIPNADIIYLGDSKNCPYGNRTKEDILNLSKAMINFLKEKGVCGVAVACNTISTLAEELRPCFDLPVISIVECAAKQVKRENLKSVGLIATCFTVNSKNYEKLIKSDGYDCNVIGRGSVNLANLVDRGDFNKTDIENEIKLCVNDILSKGSIEKLILGCTHYPIVYDNFKNCFPSLPLLNPAVAQCEEVKKLMTDCDKTEGTFELYTTGNVENYIKVIDILGMKRPDVAKTITL